jgi:hypothetical protein
MKHKIQTFLLPTEDKTHILKHATSTPLYYYDNLKEANDKKMYCNQHLYITVSQDVEPIKESWVYDPIIKKVFFIDSIIGIPNKVFKIIASDDPKLTSMKDYHGENTDDITKQCYNGVPQIQQSFLKEFVANPDGVFEVEYEMVLPDCPRNRCSIPHCSCVDVSKLKLNQDNTVNITFVEEKMYSKTDIVNGMKAMNFHIINTTTMKGQDAKAWSINWIKENL